MTNKERASKLAKDMVYAYEVCATMKDLDGAVHAWTMLAEKAITAAVEDADDRNARIRELEAQLTEASREADELQDEIMVQRIELSDYRSRATAAEARVAALEKLPNDWRQRRRDYIGPSTLQCADELESALERQFWIQEAVRLRAARRSAGECPMCDGDERNHAGDCMLGTQLPDALRGAEEEGE